MQVASQPIVQNGLGVSLMQTYDSLEEVMVNLRRLNRWKFADVAQIETGAGHRLEFAFHYPMSDRDRQPSTSCGQAPDNCIYQTDCSRP
jgi:hypothetical protein